MSQIILLLFATSKGHVMSTATTQLVLVILCHRGVTIELIRSQIAPKVIKSTVFDKMGRSNKGEASLTPVS